MNSCLLVIKVVSEYVSSLHIFGVLLKLMQTQISVIINYSVKHWHPIMTYTLEDRRNLKRQSIVQKINTQGYN